MKKLVLSLLLLTFASAFGQKSIDLGNVYWRISPANGIEGFAGKRTMNMFAADAKAPIVLNDNDVLIFGLEYQYNSITSNSILHSDYRFSSSMLQIGWEHKWNERSKMLFMAIPRFNSDYNDVRFNHHFQLGGLALGTTSRSEKFDWKYGVYYNGERFGPMIVPLFGFNWRINDQLQFKLTIPVSLELAYQPKDWFRTGLRFDGVNASYAYQAIPGFASTDGYIDKADNNAWLFAEAHLGKNFWFHIKAGHSVLRKYRYFTKGDQMNLKLGPVNVGDDRNWNDPKSVPVLFQNGWSFETRLIYRLPL